jgi:hypothetical protein
MRNGLGGHTYLGQDFWTINNQSGRGLKRERQQPDDVPISQCCVYGSMAYRAAEKEHRGHYEDDRKLKPSQGPQR